MLYAIIITISLIGCVSSQSCQDLLHAKYTLPETSQAGTLVHEFWLDPKLVTVNLIYIEPVSGLRDDDYLKLVPDPNGWNYTIELEQSLDLNVLNPRDIGHPDTDEPVQCDFEDSDSGFQLPPKLDIQYTIHCVTDSQNTVDFSLIVIINPVPTQPPYFLCDPYYKNISELLLVGNTVFLMEGLGYDPDFNGQITQYNLTEGAGADMFSVQGAESKGNIVLDRPLDYDYGDREFTLNITVTDDGMQSNWTYLYLTVIDGDDQSPQFSQEIYNITIQEQNSSLVNQSLWTTAPVYAYDLDRQINATINYTLLSGSLLGGVDYFALNGSTGAVIPLQELDREAIPQYLLYIEAYQEDNADHRKTRSLIQVLVSDVNDHPPVMSHAVYEVTIPENYPQGLFVISVAAQDRDEGDNAVFEYHLEGEAAQLSGFEIHPQTGDITVNDVTVLDRETHPVIVLQVYAQETLTDENRSSNKSDIIITLSDVNDNSPSFDDNQVSLAMPLLVNMAIGYSSDKRMEFIGGLKMNDSIVQVNASDPDAGSNGNVGYTLDFTLVDWIGLDPDTGHLYAASDYFPAVQTTDFVLIGLEDKAVITSNRRKSTAVIEVVVIPLVTTALPTTTAEETTAAMTTEAVTTEQTTIQQSTSYTDDVTTEVTPAKTVATGQSSKVTDGYVTTQPSDVITGAPGLSQPTGGSGVSTAIPGNTIDSTATVSTVSIPGGSGDITSSTPTPGHGASSTSSSSGQNPTQGPGSGDLSSSATGQNPGDGVSSHTTQDAANPHSSTTTTSDPNNPVPTSDTNNPNPDPTLYTNNPNPDLTQATNNPNPDSTKATNNPNPDPTQATNNPDPDPTQATNNPNPDLTQATNNPNPDPTQGTENPNPNPTQANPDPTEVTNPPDADVTGQTNPPNVDSSQSTTSSTRSTTSRNPGVDPDGSTIQVTADGPGGGITDVGGTTTSDSKVSGDPAVGTATAGDSTVGGGDGDGSGLTTAQPVQCLPVTDSQYSASWIGLLALCCLLLLLVIVLCAVICVLLCRHAAAEKPGKYEVQTVYYNIDTRDEGGDSVKSIPV